MRRRGWIFLAVTFWLLLSFPAMETPASQEKNADESWGQEFGLEDFELDQIQDYLDSTGRYGGTGLSFGQMMEAFLKGDFLGAFSMVLESFKSTLFAEIRANGKMIGQVILLGILSAVFSNFSSVFSSSQISETGFFVAYLLMFTFLASSFFTSITIAGQVLEDMMGFMKVLVPSYFLAVAFAGGTMTSAALYQFMLLAMTGMQWLFSSMLLPLVRAYILMTLAGHLTKEDLLSKMTELICNVIQWGTKTAVGLVLGVQMLQGLVLPYADAVKSTAVHRMVGVIPGIGQGASAVSQMVLGSGVLIKNTMGAVAVVVLFLMVLVPVLKLVVLMLLYQGAAAVMQPVCDKRLVACIYDVGKGHKLLLSLVLASLFLFVISIAIVCLSTNTTYYAG